MATPHEIGPPDIHHRRLHGFTAPLRLGVLVTAGALVLGIIIALWGQGEGAERRALARMDPATRRDLYARTLHNAEVLCEQAHADEALRDRCVESVDFLQLFPECDDKCQALTGRFKRQPSR